MLPQLLTVYPHHILPFQIADPTACDTFWLGYGYDQKSNTGGEFGVGSRVTVDWHVNLERLSVSWET